MNRGASKVVLGIVLVAGGCGRPAPYSGPGGNLWAEPAAKAKGDSPPEQRRIIRTAELWLDATSLLEARTRAEALANAKGGFVSSVDVSQSHGEDGEETTGVDLMLRVPVAAYDATLADLRRLGTRVSREKTDAQDVTEEFVDQEARIGALRSVQEQLTAILHRANSVHDALEAQEKLGAVQVELERAEGRRRFLANQTELASFTVHLARHLDALDGGGTGFARSFIAARHDAWVVTVAVLTGAVRVLGVLLPLAVVFGVPAGALYLLLRLRRRRARAGSASSG